ncbi:MAG: hypothetical protein Q9187_001915 [Circinaria calcarea]
MAALTDIVLPENFRLLARGKVRHVFEIDQETLLFVATDRISAYDVVMKNGVREKGSLLTQLSAFWFRYLSRTIPGLRTHFISLDLPRHLPPSLHEQLRRRSMQVRKVQIFPIEAIVRGYITGSAWKEYQARGTVHGMKVQSGLRESEEFPGGPLYTPSTKAEPGSNDENIHPDRAAEIIGRKYADCIRNLAINLYTKAREYALERGIIIADTKFEFGLDTETSEVILVDEVLTPDSSRFWPASSYKVGQGQESFDKQYLRDWLTSYDLKGKPDVEMPEEIVGNTANKYREAYERLVGTKWESVS